MDTETTDAEKALPEQEAPKTPGRPPPTMITSTTNLIRFQRDVKYHIKREYEFRNTGNRARTTTKETVDYSAMKFYLEKNNFQFLPKFRKDFKGSNLSPSPSNANGRYLQQL
jgi:hypothetical protein